MGVPVGIVLGLLLLAAAVFFVLSWRKRKRREVLQKPENEAGVPLKPPAEYVDDRGPKNYGKFVKKGCIVGVAVE